MPLNSEEHLFEVANVCDKKWGMLKKRPVAFLLSAFAGGAFVCFELGRASCRERVCLYV